MVWELLVTSGPQSILSRQSWEQLGQHGKTLAWRLEELDCILIFLQEISTGSPKSTKQSLHLQDLPVLNTIRPRTPRPTLHEDADAELCRQSPQYLNRPSPGYHFFYSPMGLDDPLPFYGDDFSPFRALGLGIWM